MTPHMPRFPRTLGESLAVQPVQDLLNLVILGVISFVNAAMADSYTFQYENVNFPTQKGTTHFFDMLEDLVEFVKVLPGKLMDPCILGNNLKVLII